jgi:hypothetical protein
MKHELDRTNPGKGTLGDLPQGVRYRVVIGGRHVKRPALALRIVYLDRDHESREPGAPRRREMVGKLAVELGEDVALHGLCELVFPAVVLFGMHHLEHGNAVETGLDDFFKNATHTFVTPFSHIPSTLRNATDERSSASADFPRG